jgi:hypothetical protein
MSEGRRVRFQSDEEIQVAIAQDFYIFPEEVFRLGNSTSHKLTAIKAREVTVITINAVPVIVADGRGVSVFTLEGILREGLTGFAWQFAKGTPVTQGLKLILDPLKDGHYFLCPRENMPVDKYKGLLEEMGVRCHKYLQIKKDGAVVRVGS